MIGGEIINKCSIQKNMPPQKYTTRLTKPNIGGDRKEEKNGQKIAPQRERDKI